MKGYANGAILSLPGAGHFIDCRAVDPDSTRFVESDCGDLSDCNRRSWSDGGKAFRAMVVEIIILKRSSIGQLQIRPRIFCSLNGAGVVPGTIGKGAGAIGSALLAGIPGAGSKAI